MEYQDFLKTDYWKIVSEQVKQRAHYKCQLCGCSDRVLHAHHNTYEHHGEEHKHLEYLVCLCDECHKFYHLKEQYKKDYKEMKNLLEQYKKEKDYADWKLKNFYDSRCKNMPDLSIDKHFCLFDDDFEKELWNE